MKTLNRPMFRMGGPIKEGIMHGIEEPRRKYNQGAFGTSAYTKEDYDNFIKRMFVTPPPSETTIPGILRPDVKNFFQDGQVTDKYSYENLFKPGQSIFSDNIFDYSSAGMPGDKSRRIFTGGKTGFATALKKDILSKLPKMERPAVQEDFEITTDDIEEDRDNPTYISKMQEGTLKRGGDAETLLPKKKPEKKVDTAETTNKDKLREILGYDRAVKRGNYRLIEAIRKGLTEGGVQGALDAAFAAGEGAYQDADKLRQVADLKQYERELELKDYDKKRKDALEDKITFLKEKQKIDPDEQAKGIIQKNYEFLTGVLKMDADKARRIATKETEATLDAQILDVQKSAGLPAVTTDVLDGAGGIFYGSEYKGKASSQTDTGSMADGWYLIDGAQFVEIENGKVVGKSRKYEPKG